MIMKSKSMLVLIAFLSMNLSLAEVHQSSSEKFKFEVVAEQKDVVWGFDFLDSDRMIFTEREGRLKILNLKTKKVTDVTGTPAVSAKGQGGLLDVRVHPKNKDQIYLTYAEPSDKGATTALGVYQLEGDKLTSGKKLFSAHEPNTNKIHFGSRIEFDDQGSVFMTVGDRDERKKAQDLKHHNGKIVKIGADDKAEVWSYGHRNPQGLVRDNVTGNLWSAEMGPRGGDELNLIRKGANYGWPVITYGKEYYGLKIGEGNSKEGMEQPVVYWVPSISPSGITIYTGDKFKSWRGNIFIGTLSGTHLRRLKLNENKVVEQEELLKSLSLRIRNVRTGPEGFFYLSMDDGRIARLVPQ